jgi:hypothetical protein
MSLHNKTLETVTSKINGPFKERDRRHSKSQSAFNYDNTSSNLAATTMRNELNKLVETAPPDAKEVCLPSQLVQRSTLRFEMELTSARACRNLELKWTTSLHCFSDTSPTRQRGMKCKPQSLIFLYFSFVAYAVG